MSFTRQLNLWGFKRITKGRDAGAYYHQLFLRGRPRLCMRMRRQKIKGTGIKLTPNPETEPNFYKISETAPLPAIDPKNKKYEPLPPLRKVGNSSTTAPPTIQNGARPPSHGAGNLNLPFEYANLLNGGRSNVPANPAAAAHRSPLNQMPPGMPSTHRRISNPSAPMSNLMMPNMTMSHQEEHRRLSTGSAGSNLSRMEMLSPSHDRSGSALRPRFQNAAAAVSNPHALLQEVRGLEMSSTADQRLSAAQELEVLAQSLREKAAAEKQQQTIVAAQRLLNQMSDPRKPNSPRSVEQLKSHLLAAAHSLDTVSANPEPREAVSARTNGHYNPLSMPRRSTAPMDPYNSLLSQSAQSRAPQGSHATLDPLMNQIPNALMNALDQTKMVAAAAQEQSALLQRFAQNLEMRRGSNGNTAESVHGMYNSHQRGHM